MQGSMGAAGARGRAGHFVLYALLINRHTLLRNVKPTARRGGLRRVGRYTGVAGLAPASTTGAPLATERSTAATTHSTPTTVTTAGQALPLPLPAVGMAEGRGTTRFPHRCGTCVNTGLGTQRSCETIRNTLPQGAGGNLRRKHAPRRIRCGNRRRRAPQGI